MDTLTSIVPPPELWTPISVIQWTPPTNIIPLVQPPEIWTPPLRVCNTLVQPPEL